MKLLEQLGERGTFFLKLKDGLACMKGAAFLLFQKKCRMFLRFFFNKSGSILDDLIFSGIR